MGLGLGILPRVLSAEIIYEQVVYVKKYAPFSTKYITHNLPLYLIITTVLLPGGLYVLWKYKEEMAGSIKLALLLFLGVHLVYGYHSGDHSGFVVSLFYNGRYFIPTLPLWMIVYASFAKSNKIVQNSKLKSGLTAICLIFIFAFNGFLFFLEKEHKKVAENIFEKYNDRIILYDNSAYRYLNPLHGKIDRLEDYRHFDVSDLSLKEEAVLVLSHKSTTERQIKFWEWQLDEMTKVDANIKVNQVENYRVFDGTEIAVFTFSFQ